ncbi:MAG: miaA [Actinomycetia bacterium]|nr:miaA [Actinomycetes bacterium]
MAPWLAVVGPTASGKSALALELARAAGDVELVSADAMQVYRGMDIGTAKPSAAERAEVAHHLIDVAEPADDFSLARFVELGRAAIADIDARGRRSLIVGGTGLYVRGLVDELEVPGQFPDVRAALDADPDTEGLHRRLAGLDPLAASRMEPTNRRRVVRALEVTLGAGRPFSSFGPGLDAYPPVSTALVGLHVPLDELDRRIAARVDAMLEAGFLDEVRALGPPSRTARQALGYRELLEHLEAGVPLADAVDRIKLRTRQFARRQLRWFRRDQRVRWVDGTLSPSQVARSVADGMTH